MKFQALPLFLFVLLPFSLFAQAPQIVSQPGNKIICVGDAVAISVEATGAETLVYEWFHETTPIAGSNSPVLSFDPIDLADSGEYYCVVTNGEGSVTSETVQIIVQAGLPEVATLSSGGTFCEAEDVSLSVSVTEGPVNFMWYKDEEFVSGAYGPTLMLNGLASSDAGVYYCELSNACGEVLTDEITISVAQPVELVTQPVGQVVCEGNDAEINVGAEGSYLEFQWYENGSEMTGEINSQLTVEDVQTDNSSSYYCIVSNMCNSIQTNTVGLTVNTYPSVTAHPLSANACVGEEISLTSTATGTPEITNQWYVNGEAVVDSVFSTLTVTLETADTLFVYNEYTNGCGTVHSDSAILSPDVAPVITQQPSDTVGCEGTNVSFRVKVVGAEPIYYQWQLNGADVNGAEYSGDNTFELNITGIDQSHEGDYTCIITNGCGTITSDPAELEIILPPSIASQPDDLTLCEGDEASFEMIVQGSEPFEYAWMNPGSDQVLSTNAVFSIQSVTTDDANDYYCVVSNQCADVNSEQATLTVNTYPEFVLQPEDIDACHGDSVALEVNVEGTGPIDLLWFRNEGAITDAEDTVLIFDPAETLETGYFFCTAMNQCGITESDEVFVNIGTAPAITWNPVGQSLCENETLLLHADASGENVFYQWFNNGVVVSGQNDTALMIPAVDDAMAGEFYFQAYNGCAAVNSDTVDVEIFPAPEFDLGDDQEFCDGESIILSTDVMAQSYSWNNGLSNSASLEVDQTGEYTLAAIGDNGCTGYDTVYVEVHPYHTVILGDDLSNCGPMTLDAGDGAYSYLWNTGSDESTISVSESGQYYCTAAGDDFGCLSTDTINVVILEVPVIDLGDDHTIARDSSVTLSVEEGFLSYYWSNSTNLHEAVYTGDYLGVGTHDAWVFVTAQNGCTTTDTVQITVLQGESVNQLSPGEDVALYPNPAKNAFVIDYELNETLNSIQIYDLRGRIVMNRSCTDFQGLLHIDLSTLQSGLYVVNLSTKSRSINYRLIKE